MLPYYLAYGASEYFKLKFFRDKTPFGCSLAPTIQCNLSCKQCYEHTKRTSSKKELSLDEMDMLAEKLSKQGIKHCTMTDGEPLISRESIEKCETIIDHFWMNYIVTNGTKEIPDFPVFYILSLDGPPKVHDNLRGDGVFHQLKNNVKKSPTDNIYGLCTLNSLNHEHISQTISTAEDLGLKGIMFNWYNPASDDDSLWVDYETRNKDIDLLLDLMEDKPDFIYNTKFELDMLRNPEWTKSCPSYFVPSYDAFGDLKTPCVFGERAFCEKCGCHVFPVLMESIAKGRKTAQFRLALDYMDQQWTKDSGILSGLISPFLSKE